MTQPDEPAGDAIRVGPHWQPMESAPKDGSRLLMVCCNYGTVRVSWWDAPHETWAMFHLVEPTHWMPLPDPPAVVAHPQLVENKDDLQRVDKWGNAQADLPRRNEGDT